MLLVVTTFYVNWLLKSVTEFPFCMICFVLQTLALLLISLSDLYYSRVGILVNLAHMSDSCYAAKNQRQLCVKVVSKTLCMFAGKQLCLSLLVSVLSHSLGFYITLILISLAVVSCGAG